MSSSNPIAQIKDAQEACGITTFTPLPNGGAVSVTHFDTKCIRKRLGSRK